MAFSRRSFLKLSVVTGLASGLFNHPMGAQTPPSVTLAWDAAGGATAYRVRYGTQSGTYPLVTSATSGTALTVGGLSPGVTYYFVATALDAAGRESGRSNQISYAVPSAPPTPTPTPTPTPKPKRHGHRWF